MSMLVIKNLNVSYGDFHVLFGINMEVEKGSVTAIIGSNGAGKTTLLRAISGILRPISGNILLLDERIDTLPPYKIREKGIAFVMEERGLFPYMTVRENLLLGAMNSVAWKRRAERLEYVYSLFPRLKEREKQLAGTLSGGEQQMLNIGKELMSSPTLLMLDEPSRGLAPNLVQFLYEILKKINDEGVTILLVEQNVERGLLFAKKAFVIENGKIVMEGAGKELVNNPKIREAYIGL
jgi:branched-chain amino acid transport system ATP-binding protein